MCAVKRHLVKGTIWIIWLTSSQQLWISLSPFSVIWIWLADIILKECKCSMMNNQTSNPTKIQGLVCLPGFYITILFNLSRHLIGWYLLGRIENYNHQMLNPRHKACYCCLERSNLRMFYHSSSSHGLVGDAASFDSRTTSWK